jgi:tetratricopeptide (TPR) repeat protein
LNIAFSFQGERLVAAAEIRFTGALGDNLKIKHKYDHTVRDNMIKVFNTIFPKGRSTEVKITSNTTNEDPFIASSRLEFSDIWSDVNEETLSYAGSLTTLLQLFTNLTQLPPVKDRFHDVKFAFGYRLQMNSILASPAESYKPLLLSGNDNAHNQYFSYSRHIIEEDGVVRAELDFTLHNPKIEVADYARFHQDIQDIQNRSTWQVTYKLDKNHQRMLELQEQIGEGSDKVDSLLKLARHHLMLADYVRARELANQAAAVDPRAGEAYYLLGITHGFLDDYEASKSALDKAEVLGYQP